MNSDYLARTPGELDPDRLTSILRGTGTIGPSCQVTGVKYAPVGDGMMSDSFRFTLDYAGDSGGEPATIVGKFAAEDPTSRATARGLRLYETEVLFYEQLADTVEVHTPRILLAVVDRETQDFTLLMEDQSPARSVDQMVGCSLDDCRIAMREMARLHGPRWGDPHLAELEWFRRRNDALLEVAGQGLGASIEDYCQRFGDRLDPEHLDVVQRFEHVWLSVMQDEAAPRTVVHTDFRPDNLLFDARGREGTVVVLDWAGILHLSGLLDVGYFLGSALVADDRRTHEKDLLREYFDELAKYPIGGYNFDDCWLDYRRYPFYGLFTALMAQMMVERSERSDALFLQMGRQFCEMVTDLDSMSLWT